MTPEELKKHSEIVNLCNARVRQRPELADMYCLIGDKKKYNKPNFKVFSSNMLYPLEEKDGRFEKKKITEEEYAPSILHNGSSKVCCKFFFNTFGGAFDPVRGLSIKMINDIIIYDIGKEKKSDSARPPHCWQEEQEQEQDHEQYQYQEQN